MAKMGPKVNPKPEEPPKEKGPIEIAIEETNKRINALTQILEATAEDIKNTRVLATETHAIVEGHVNAIGTLTESTQELISINKTFNKDNSTLRQQLKDQMILIEEQGKVIRTLRDRVESLEERIKRLESNVEPDLRHLG